VVLAIHLKREAFEHYLSEAVYSSYQSNIYESREAWQDAVKQSNVRLQWDPDHDPYGAKLDRRIIQLGIRNKEIESYAKDHVIEIEDISAYVNEQNKHVLNNDLDALNLPYEKPFVVSNKLVSKKLGLDKC